jgi:cold shock protein
MFLCLREVALEHFSVHRGDDLLAIMELPGVDKNDLQIQAKANTIRISGKKNVGYSDGASNSFNEDRGYGFIVPDGGGSDVFVHVHDVEAAGMKTLVAGQLLTYNTAPARDGRTKAVNLRLLNPER